VDTVSWSGRVRIEDPFEFGSHDDDAATEPPGRDLVALSVKKNLACDGERDTTC
jgi:hypothetical protein